MSMVEEIFELHRTVSLVARRRIEREVRPPRGPVMGHPARPYAASIALTGKEC
jgi:hypothetical protein